MRSFWLAVLIFASAVGFGQNGDPAERIYQSSQNSVFLVYLNDSSGNPDALGSAFLVAPTLLVTNAHVAEAGNPVLAVGPLRVPLKVVRIDQENDLALLSIDLKLTSKPLILSNAPPSPGEQIFAIGNPEGLEKTISQGIVSGIRTFEGRDLVQITSPISHGSSGGPILNSSGEVIGVTVSMLTDGQNLNFAVPAKYVRALLEKKSSLAVSSLNCSESMQNLSDLARKRSQEPYSGDSSSQYQQDTQQLLDHMTALSNACAEPVVLKQLACLGTTGIDLRNAGIEAARRLVAQSSTAEDGALLAYVLYDGAQDEDILTAFSKDGSSEKTEAVQAGHNLLNEAEQRAIAVRRQAKGEPLLIASYVLAGADDHGKDYSQAIALNTLVVNGRPMACGSDLASTAYLSLISENSQISNPAESERWFREYASKYEPQPYQWDAEGDRRYNVGDLSSAADAYERAAAGSQVYQYDYCYAADDKYMQTSTDADAVLSDGRKCVDASVKDTNENDQKQFQHALPVVYRSMAEVLNDRGVYQQALEYVKESIGLDPNNPFSLASEAKILENLERYPECISAAQAAINASDGKYGFMHFRLGSCYFASENWSQAADSFRLAAEDKSDAASAFDLGLSLSRQGYSSDAQEWFREALRRNPDSDLRVKILSALQ